MVAGHAAAEPDTRYAMLLAVFRANKKADPYSPTAPDADRAAASRTTGR